MVYADWNLTNPAITMKNSSEIKPHRKIEITEWLATINAETYHNHHT